MKREILITGATGYIGSMLVKHIIQTEAADVTALVRSTQKAREMLPEGVKIIEADLTDRAVMETLDGRFDEVIHGAAITQSFEMVTHPLEVISSIVNATQHVMELALRCHAKSVVYLSSMESYGSVAEKEGRRITEEQAGAGRVDILSARSCYPLGKRMAENICYCYYKEHGLPVKIVRLAQVFGRGILPEDNRVFAQFVRAVLQKQDIVLHTAGDSMGNYCEIEDAIAGILTVLAKGRSGEAYNVVNEACTMRIAQMAELVAEEVAQGKISVRYEIQNENIHGYAAPTGLSLSSEKLRGLGWCPQKGLAEMYQDALRTAKSI